MLDGLAEFKTAGTWVRLRDNPGRMGAVTGNSSLSGTRTHVEVSFGPNDVRSFDTELLELVPSTADPFEELEAGNFGTDGDLRRLVTMEKVRGQLTNVFYSMESSNTDFYPHQFKPVLKFIESPVGRLLIADEVGLGKTIEAGYIWKELQARQDAGRLLIVCPAALCEKWRDDLANRFSIHADVLGAKDLLARLTARLEHGAPAEFVYICSLEGIRTPRGYEDEDVKNARAELGRILEANPSNADSDLFDLVVIDEAHELRNEATANNRLGNLLRDATKHLVLLTATPIQIGSGNLYQLLRLVSPEDFFSQDIFDDILEANEPITRALRLMWRQPVDVEGSREAIDEALQSDYFRSNATLKRVRDELDDAELGIDARIKAGKTLENASLLGHYMSRSRKRDVLLDPVVRIPITLTVQLSDIEHDIYTYVTNHIRQKAAESETFQIFAEIARQRQMASCMVAALEHWKRGGFLDEVLSEDLGLTKWSFDDDGDGGAEDDGQVVDEAWPFDDGQVDIAMLEANDSKYHALSKYLHDELARNPEAKIVIFAFFRGTLAYLQRRLTADGISNTKIVGGMGDEKWVEIRKFLSKDGPQVLLSSEVGSQGIDLQTARILVNYDLPWNPMRVEQRIGRLDRLGQDTTKPIKIINMVRANTIEDRILERLYRRIKIFEQSIGDLEQILGEMTEMLARELFAANVTDEERERRAQEIEDTIVKRRVDQEKLEEEAINLTAFSDYVVDSINDSRDTGRWLKPHEIERLVIDFLNTHYPGTGIGENKNFENAIDLRLSEQAKRDFDVFRIDNRASGSTRLITANKHVTCVFDPRRVDDLSGQMELVDPTHPLLRWVRGVLEGEGVVPHPVSAISVAAEHVELDPGIYGYVVHRWSMDGIRDDQRLLYRAMRLGGDAPLGGNASETLLSSAILNGKAWNNARNNLDEVETWEDTLEAIAQCEERLRSDYDAELEYFEAENENRCDVQLKNAERFAERRTENYETMLRDRKRSQNASSSAGRGMITRYENILVKERHDLEVKRTRIENRRKTSSSKAILSVGVLRVT